METCNDLKLNPEGLIQRKYQAQNVKGQNFTCVCIISISCCPTSMKTFLSLFLFLSHTVLISSGAQGVQNESNSQGLDTL